MSEIRKIMEKKSRMRRKLLKQQLGLNRESDLGLVLGKKFYGEVSSRESRSRKTKPTATSVVQPRDSFESLYTDSKRFLKGNKNKNPHNDYCQNFIDTGQRPQNYVRDAGLMKRFEEYPKLRELIRLKDELVATTATPPMYQHADLTTFSVTNLKMQFDCILIEPPLHEYQTQNGAVYEKYWSWDEISQLEIDKIASHRAFLWMWCGCEGLDVARECLRRWGFRRCEDICWIKTNSTNPGKSKNMAPTQIFQRTKEHCLMGIKGTVRRSTDGDFIHANVDMDLIIDEEPPYGCKEKPVEMFHIIEHFCLGRRRLHLFGRDSTIRPGWLTVGPEVTTSNFDAEIFRSFFNKAPGPTTGCPEEIEKLRPKSPPPKTAPTAEGGTDLSTPSDSLQTQPMRGRGMRGRGGPHQGNRGSFTRGRGSGGNMPSYRDNYPM